MLWLYAVASPSTRTPLGCGLSGEPVSAIEIAGIAVLAGAMPAVAPLDEPSVRGHDATIRELCRRVDAILPARFGTFLSERDLRARIEANASVLRDALAHVAGCRQMTLRFFATSRSPAPSVPDPPPGAGPGERFLRARAATSFAGRAGPLLRALAPYVRDERLVDGDPDDLVGTVLHLIATADQPRYMEALAAAERSLRGLVVRASGPWPPYGFAPEVLA